MFVINGLAINLTKYYLENVEVSLKDVYGNILFGDVVTLSPTVYSIDLESYGVLSFEIEIYADEVIYYGNFSL